MRSPLWFLVGSPGVASAGTSETNAPSLWSGGVRWATTTTPYKAYWQSSAAPTARTGEPAISIAVGGVWLNATIMRASWQLGRDQWLSQLAPASASFAFVGATTFEPMSEVVIGLMSAVTDQHSDSLWVGYADSVDRTTDPSGLVMTSVSCVDVIGILAQSEASSGDPPERFLADVVEFQAAEAGVPITVDDDGRGSDYPVMGGPEDGEGTLSYINRAEQAVNAVLMLRGSGRLVANHRLAAGLDDPPTPVVLDAQQGTWTRQLSPTSVVNDFVENGGHIYDDPSGPPDADVLASRALYGRRAYEPDVSLGSLDAWVDVWAGKVLLEPRWLLTSASFPVSDLGDDALTLDPLDWVTLDGDDWQVMSVSHDVEPGRRWTVTISADLTQAALLGV